MRRGAMLGVLALLSPTLAQESGGAMNLLLNPDFSFHAFDSARTGRAESYRSGAVPCWTQDAYGDATVTRAPRVGGFRTRFPVDGVVSLAPGKRFSQFIALAEVGLDHGDRVSLMVFGRQAAAGALRAAVHLMRLDSAPGTWSPGEFGNSDKRTFPKHARGELVRAPGGTATTADGTEFELKVENVEIVGAFTESADNSTDQPNTIGLEVEFVNLSADQPVLLYAPCLTGGGAARSRLPVLRPLPELYRSIPRTMQKLWRGEPLHILTMGSSIDRGSANPPMYLYDEDPASATYKQPLADREFDGAKIGQPELNDFYGWWPHYFMYTGRLKRALEQKFNYPPDKILLNVMACDGSSISEEHSGLAEYASLALPPDANNNGHRTGKTWQELYPALFARPEGPRPDLVIFGSGANEKIDGADEIACFEGAIRWFQRHYPETEFLFGMWQNRESYTPNTGHLMELALRYQIPYADVGRLMNLTTRYCNSYALVPKDGHPQAAAHYLWFKQLERAFDAAEPITSGMAQLQLPERVNPYTIGWEGDIKTYPADSQRIVNGTAFILDDTMVNLWATCGDDTVGVKVDGQSAAGSRRRPAGRRDLRNSTFAVGKLSLGDRHIVEVTGKDAKLATVDSKSVPGRRRAGVDSRLWTLGALRPEPFQSAWGAPYGATQVVLPDGGEASIELPGTLFSIAWVDDAAGGTLRLEIDGLPGLEQPTNAAFTDAAGQAQYLENRKAAPPVPYGLHRLKVTAAGGPVRLLGVFAYDTRASRTAERVLRGVAAPGDTITFPAPFQARPLVTCTGKLSVRSDDVRVDGVTFGGEGAGSYEVVGQ